MPGGSSGLATDNNYILLQRTSRCVCAWVCVFVVGVCVFVVGVCMFVARVSVSMCAFGRALLVGNASMIDLLLYEIGNE